MRQDGTQRDLRRVLDVGERSGRSLVEVSWRAQVTGTLLRRWA